MSNQKTISAFAPVFLLALFTLIITSSAYGQALQASGWDFLRQGSDDQSLWYMDRNMTQLGYTFQAEDLPDDTIIQVKGIFPQADYMSIYVYNGRKYTPEDSYIDSDLTADKNNSHAYTIWIAPKSRKELEASNLLHYPDQLRKVTIIMRIYLRDSVFGSTSTPHISLFNVKEKKTQPLPPSARFIPKDRERLHQAIARRSAKFFQPVFQQLNTGALLHSYRIKNFGVRLGELSSHFLLMPVTLKEEEIALIRFKAPKADDKMSRTKADMRYWSLSLGDKESHSLLTRQHDEFTTKEGYVYLAIAPEYPNEQLPSHWNYIHWPADKPLMLVYRHILPSPEFRAPMQQAPAQSIKKLNARQHAGLSMGDYSPMGEIVDHSYQQEQYIKWQDSRF